MTWTIEQASPGPSRGTFSQRISDRFTQSKATHEPTSERNMIMHDERMEP